MKIYFAGEAGVGYGWGTCCSNLIKALSGRCTVITQQEFKNKVVLHDTAVFMPLVDHDFNAAQPNVRSELANLAYCFFESPLGPNAAANAKKYDIVFAGSTWCLDRMREAGITNGRLLIQGVDQTIFYPSPGRKPDGQFRIFSGGKFEYRKGQDLVITAFKEFAKTHPEAHLVCSWFNPWPQLIGSMDVSPHVKMLMSGRTLLSQQTYFSALLIHNGLGLSQFTVLPQLDQRSLAAEMRNTDCGLFPNRCEGGTNLVLMEYLSCGRTAAANLLTGHADLWDKAVVHGRLEPILATEDENHWAVQSVRNISSSLSLLRRIPTHPDEPMPKWTWAAAADTIMTALTDLRQPATIGRDR